MALTTRHFLEFVQRTVIPKGLKALLFLIS